MTKQWKVLRNIIVASAMIVLAACGGADESAPNKLPPPAVNLPPAIDDASVAIARDAPAGTFVYDINDRFTGNDLDRDGHALRYAIDSGNDDGLFVIDATNGRITIAQNRYTATTSYTLRVSADDGFNTDTASIVVAILMPTPVDPVIVNGSAEVSENAPSGQSVYDVNDANTGMDIDGNGDPIRYDIIGGNTGNAFTIDPASGQIIVANALDYETTPAYTLTVQATDGAGTSTADIQITITNVNEVLPQIVDASIGVPEDRAAGTQIFDFDDVSGGDTDGEGELLTYSITAGNTGGRFAIDPATGIITLANLLDFETVTNYQLTISASDGLDSATAQLMVTVINVNDITPVLSAATVVVDANATAGTLVHDVNDASTGVDNDGDGDALTYTIQSGNTAGAFAIDPATGQVRVSNPADFANTDQYVLSIQADDGLFQATADVIVNVSRIVSGLNSRPSNPECVAASRPVPAGATYTLQQVFPNLTFNLPLAMLQAPADAAYWYVVERGGVVRRFANQETVASSSVFLDISARINNSGEGGLLGLAFHPDYPSTPYAYVYYTADSQLAGALFETRISRFQTRDGGVTLEPASEVVMLRLGQPTYYHNGGQIAFGADGYLYIGLGDGGTGTAQNTRNWFGAMLRVDINVTSAELANEIFYKIPADLQTGNPFAQNPRCIDGEGSQDCPEIYAWGFRNPWRWSFDRVTGDLWLADVGQSAWEEVDVVRRNGNYGWSRCEGGYVYPPTTPPTPCNISGLINPILSYGRDDARSIVGGFVYRGTRNPGLVGKYIHGDYITKNIWALDYYNDPNSTPQLLLTSTINFVTFAEGNDGEIYVPEFYGPGYSPGGIYKLVETSSGTTNFPARLSETGCVEPTNPQQPVSGVIPYNVNVPFWSDNATKERYLAIPDGTTMTIAANGHWELPVGSVLIKHIRLGGQLIETRLLMRHTDGGWGGYSYEWLPDQSDAVLLDSGKSVDINGQTWIYPSRSECMQCHTNVAGVSLGTETIQLNREITYPTTGRTANQIDTLNAIGMIDPPLNGSAASLGLPAMINPYDAAGDVHLRARSWLHTNCAYCHQPSGPTPVNMDMRYATAGADMNVCDVIPIEDLGLGSAARRIAPGNPANSVLMVRIQDRDPLAHIMMPPLGSTLVDTAAVNLLDAWITGMGNTCPP